MLNIMNFQLKKVQTKLLKIKLPLDGQNRGTIITVIDQKMGIEPSKSRLCQTCYAMLIAK